MMEPYEDIINLPRHVSRTRPQMPRANRAAQFAPFAALTGYDSAIHETARLTENQIVLGEDAIAALDRKLRILSDEVDHNPEITVTYFKPDTRKSGGAYVTATGAIKKIDEFERTLLFTDGSSIVIESILDIDCPLFDSLAETEA